MTNALYFFIVAPLLLIRDNNFKSLFFCSVSKRIIRSNERVWLEQEAPSRTITTASRVLEQAERLELVVSACAKFYQ
jgi:hypothetical protein